MKKRSASFRFCLADHRNATAVHFLSLFRLLSLLLHVSMLLGLTRRQHRCFIVCVVAFGVMKNRFLVRTSCYRQVYSLFLQLRLKEETPFLMWKRLALPVIFIIPLVNWCVLFLLITRLSYLYGLVG